MNVLALSILASCPTLAPQAPAFDDARQIHWQRDLDDALALARAQGRALFVAVNADGESASERIVRERYRDPEWVARTRPFVCLAASVFRHTPRDHDDQGRRIPCPRLGEVTCGEHIALEPATHARFMAGVTIELFGETTERISPRHLLVQPDGTKSFDLYLLFDLRDLDRALAEASAAAPPFDRAEADAWPAHRARAAFEAELSSFDDARQACDRFWTELELRDGASAPASFVWADALRVVSWRACELDLPRRERLASLPAGLADAVARAAREVVVDPGAASSRGAGACALPLLAPLAGADSATRTLELSFAAFGSREGGADSERAQASVALHANFGGDGAHAVLEAIDGVGGAMDPLDPIRRSALRAAGAATAPPDALPELSALERALEQADALRSEHPGDPHADEAFGRAALLLARRKIQDGAGAGIEWLLEDARVALERACTAPHADIGLWLERARVANYLSRFEEQEELAAQALERLRFQPDCDPARLDDSTTEALRWLGDAGARLLAARAGGDPAVEAAGMLRAGRALAFAAASAESNATDWLSVASFFGALGRTRERVAFAEAGLRRHPDDDALRTELSNALWSAGRPDLLVSKYEAFAVEHSQSGACSWYAGYALVLQAEWLRRGEDPDGAIAAYERAALHFHRALELEPGFRDSSEHYLALGALGRGFAHLLADRRAQASRCVVEAASIRPSIVGVRDGLGREGVDLIDGCMEWRASGASPVDAAAWLVELTRADGGNPFWARAISDAALREALRAFGRGDATQGDRDLATAVSAARALLALDAAPEDRRAFAQVATVQCERWLDSGAELAPLGELASDAARALGLELPPSGAEVGPLRALVERLRAELGDARPAFRPGR